MKALIVVLLVLAAGLLLFGAFRRRVDALLGGLKRHRQDRLPPD